jgi:hypothetical protein
MLAAAEGLNPDTPHLRFYLALSVAAHTTTGPVSHGLGTVHRANHAGRAQGAGPTHLRIEQESFHRPLDERRRPLEAVIAERTKQRVQEDEKFLEALVKSLEEA